VGRQKQKGRRGVGGRGGGTQRLCKNALGSIAASVQSNGGFRPEKEEGNRTGEGMAKLNLKRGHQGDVVS